VIVKYAPIVSDASGRFGGLVFSKWRATRVVRSFRAPSNPNSTDQAEVRAIFSNCGAAWLQQGTYTRLAWEAYAIGKNFLGRNAFIARQVPALQGIVNLDDYVGTPGDASTLAPVSMVVTPGATNLACAVTTPAVPSGWAIARVVAYALRDVNFAIAPATIEQKEATDATAPYAPDITGLTSQEDYNVRAFIVWTAPDSTTRYSASIAAQATTT